MRCNFWNLYIYIFFKDYKHIASDNHVRRPLPPKKNKPRFPTGPPLSFYIGKKKRFPMPAAENGFQILNLHSKIHRKRKNIYPFLMHIYPNNTGFP